MSSATAPSASHSANKSPTVHDLIWRRWITLLDIKRRVYVLRAFVAELDRVTRGKKFQIRNDVVWNMVLDYRDKLVIDLYSFTVELRHGIKPPHGRVSRAFLAKRGLFVELRDQYLSSFQRHYVPHADDDQYEIAQGIVGKAQQFRSLFPSCAGDTPSRDDMELLCESCRLAMAQLGDDRNKNRAHAHEGDVGQVQMHSVDDLEKLFNWCEDILEKLSIVSSGASLGGGDMNNADSAETAADQVDQVLFGNISDIRRLLQGRTRDQLYSRLHEIDDERDREDEDRNERFFNNRQFDTAFEDFAVMLWQHESSNPT